MRLHKLNRLVCRLRADWKESQLNFNAVRWVLCFFLLCLLNNFYGHCAPTLSLFLSLYLSLSLPCEVYTKCHQIAIFTFILNDIYVSQWLHFISNWNCLLSLTRSLRDSSPGQARHRGVDRTEKWGGGGEAWFTDWQSEFLMTFW